MKALGVLVFMLASMALPLAVSGCDEGSDENPLEVQSNRQRDAQAWESEANRVRRENADRNNSY